MAALFGVPEVERIVAFAKRYPVFPCTQDKRPRTKRGFHDASQDPEQVREWWRRWPDSLVGVPTGQITGIVAIDYDPDKATNATHAWLAAHTDLLTSTRVHTTARGGKHYLFRSSDRFQTGTDLVLDGSPRRGLDLRASGGYVIWWPAHLGQSDDSAIAPLPSGLIDERAFDRKRDMAELPPAPVEWTREHDKVREALGFLHPDGYEHWIRIGMAVHHASGGSDEGFALWHDWSARGESYDGIEDCRYHWASFGGYEGRALGVGTIYAQAKAHGFNPIRVELPPLEVYAEETGDKPAAKRDAIDWSALEGREPPPRIWRVDHWMGAGPMLLAGRGGIGKSLLAQVMGTALALGRFYIDQIAEPQTVLMWSCEDDRDEIWRRQIAICKFFDVPLSTLAGKLIIEPRIGKSNALFGMAFGQPTWTSLREELVEQVNDYRATVLFMDNIGQVFGGNENDRHHVTTFVNGISGLTEWPLSSVLLGHPAKGAESEFSGSTAWENAVRMRWFLGTSLPDQKDAAEAEDGIRYLAKRKSNYSVNDWRRLVYRDGCLCPDNPPNAVTGYASIAHHEQARRVILNGLRRLNEMNIPTTHAANSPANLPKKLIEMKLSEDYGRNDLARAMNDLLVDGKIAVGVVGRYDKGGKRTGLMIPE